MSSGYKDHIAGKGGKDETYTADGVALFCISGTSVHNNKVLQVDAVCSMWFLILKLFLFDIFQKSEFHVNQILYVNT